MYVTTEGKCSACGTAFDGCHALLAKVEFQRDYIADLEEVLEDKKRIAREIDVILNGENGAAKQASLIDLMGQIEELIAENGSLKEQLKTQTDRYVMVSNLQAETHRDAQRTWEEKEKLERKAKRYEEWSCKLLCENADLIERAAKLEKEREAHLLMMNRDMQDRIEQAKEAHTESVQLRRALEKARSVLVEGSTVGPFWRENGISEIRVALSEHTHKPEKGDTRSGECGTWVFVPDADVSDKVIDEAFKNISSDLLGARSAAGDGLPEPGLNENRLESRSVLPEGKPAAQISTYKQSRCWHGVHGTDCFKCFPTQQETSPEDASKKDQRKAPASGSDQIARPLKCQGGESTEPLCELCGNPMPLGETMFKYHGYSGPCPESLDPFPGIKTKADLSKGITKHYEPICALTGDATHEVHEGQCVTCYMASPEHVSSVKQFCPDGDHTLTHSGGMNYHCQRCDFYGTLVCKDK